MTIETRYGDMLALKRGILVHGCNVKGAMGAGIALAIKQRYPSVYRVYREAFEREGLALGTITFDEPEPDLIIVNAVTQDHWQHSDPTVVLADYEAIEQAFRLIRGIALDRKLPVHFPLIGCGLARGDWNEVAPRIERALGGDVERYLWRLGEA